MFTPSGNFRGRKFPGCKCFALNFIKTLFHCLPLAQLLVLAIWQCRACCGLFENEGASHRCLHLHCLLHFYMLLIERHRDTERNIDTETEKHRHRDTETHRGVGERESKSESESERERPFCILLVAKCPKLDLRVPHCTVSFLEVLCRNLLGIVFPAWVLPFRGRACLGKLWLGDKRTITVLRGSSFSLDHLRSSASLSAKWT